MVIRKATNADIQAIVNVHMRAFNGFFLTQLGAGFLTELYRGFLWHDKAVLWVAENRHGELLGFAAGTVVPERFFYDLRKQRALYFLYHAIPALLRNPRLVFSKLYSAIFYRGDKPSSIEGGALLSSIGVAPDAAGKNIGMQLLKCFEDDVFAVGAPCVYLTTDERSNERVQHFYTRNGYTVETRFMQSGNRPMLRYLKKLS